MGPPVRSKEGQHMRKSRVWVTAEKIRNEAWKCITELRKWQTELIQSDTVKSWLKLVQSKLHSQTLFYLLRSLTQLFCFAFPSSVTHFLSSGSNPRFPHILAIFVPSWKPQSCTKEGILEVWNIPAKFWAWISCWPNKLFKTNFFPFLYPTNTIFQIWNSRVWSKSLNV